MSKNKDVEIKVHSSPFNFVKYCLAIGNDELVQVCNMFGIDHSMLGSFTSGARLTTVTKENSVLCILRLLPEHRYSGDADLTDSLRLIVHEVTHIKQELMNSMVEDNPSCEFEAYTMDEIFHNIITDYFQRV